jgi:hypothetical protein
LVEPDREKRDIIPRPNLGQRRAWLRYLDVDRIILHKAQDEAISEYRPLIESLAGAATDEDKVAAAFAVPGDVAPPAESLLYTVGGKWSPPFRSQSGKWARWVRGSGHIYIYATEAQQVRILFTVSSVLDLAHLELEVDGLIDRFVVDDRSTYASRSLAWEPGMHTLVFRRAYEPWALNPEGGRWDVFALEGVRVVPESDLPRGSGLDVDLGGLVRLTGYGLAPSSLRPERTLTVTLNWQATEPLREDLVVFAHLLDEDDTLVAQWDGEPGDGRFPTSAWPVGSTVGQSVPLQLPADMPSGNYRLLVGMYRWPSVKRLPVQSDVPGAEDNVIMLEKFRVSP